MYTIKCRKHSAVPDAESPPPGLAICANIEAGAHVESTTVTSERCMQDNMINARVSPLGLAIHVDIHVEQDVSHFIHVLVPLGLLGPGHG